MGIIGFLIIGLIAGWLAGKIMRGGGFGLIGNRITGHGDCRCGDSALAHRRAEVEVGMRRAAEGSALPRRALRQGRIRLDARQPQRQAR